MLPKVLLKVELVELPLLDADQVVVDSSLSSIGTESRDNLCAYEFVC